jgi:ribosome-associated protein
MTSENTPLTQLVLDALDDLKAVDVRVIDVRELTTVTDYMIVASGRSDRQVRSIADHVAMQAKAAGLPPLGTEGQETGEWVLVDMGDVVLHVMDPETRDVYQLEKLWEMPARLRALEGSTSQGESAEDEA